MSAPTFSHFPHIPPPVGVRLTVLPERPCAYLPGRNAQLRAFAVAEIAPGVYQRFMDAGFRRSGVMLYQPICTGCRQCQAIRLRVDAFRPGRSQRRARTRNADVLTTVSAPVADAERFALYRDYQTRWHGEADEPPEYDEFVRFLYSSPTRTIEFAHRVNDRLVAVGICDLTADGLSSVYFYFNPDEARRSLGVFGALVEIDYARAASIPFYLLGYYVRDCAAMQYKADYGPAELLGMDGCWRPKDEG